MSGVVEASELGLAPGEWPYTLEYDGKTWSRVTPMTGLHNEFVGYLYELLPRNADGSARQTLEVLND